MAECFPENIPGFNSEVANLWSVIKRLPDAWQVWISLHPSGQCHDFLLLRAGRYPVYISHTLDEDGVEEAAARLAEVRSAAPGCTVVVASRRLTHGLFFRAVPKDIPFWGADNLDSPPNFLKAVSNLDITEMPPEAVSRLRTRIAPEVVIPSANLTIHEPESEPAPRISIAHLLDYRQEDVVKRDLELSAEGTEEARQPKGRIVTGVAGCGKSLVLLHRAKLLQELYPSARCLLITHNRPLTADLKLRSERLSANGRTAYWQTFQGWCLGMLSKFGRPIKINDDIVQEENRQALIARTHHAQLAATSISSERLNHEIGWIKDNLLHERAEYLAADRQGRGFALAEHMREQVFEAFLDYQSRLSALGKYDWEDVPRLLWQTLEENGDGDLNRYDAVMVDEAQFLPPVAYRLILRALKPGGQLLLAADPTQGFLRRGQSWQGMGIDVRGRAHRLTTCYRTTAAILSFAADFYRKRIRDDDPDILLPDDAMLAVMEKGKPPVVDPADTFQDELAKTGDHVGTLLADGVPPGDILVLNGNGTTVESTIRYLGRKFPEIPVCNFGVPHEWAGDQLRVCSLNRATGLESPWVFVLGLGDLLKKEGGGRDPEDRHTLLRDNTRRMYMAFTRAASRLVLFLPRKYTAMDCFSPVPVHRG